MHIRFTSSTYDVESSRYRWVSATLQEVLWLKSDHVLAQAGEIVMHIEEETANYLPLHLTTRLYMTDTASRIRRFDTGYLTLELKARSAIWPMSPSHLWFALEEVKDENGRPVQQAYAMVAPVTKPQLKTKEYNECVNRCKLLGRSFKNQVINEAQMEMEMAMAINYLLELHGIDTNKPTEWVI